MTPMISMARWAHNSCSVVQLLSHVQLFMTPRTAAHLTSLHCLPEFELMSIESMMPCRI